MKFIIIIFTYFLLVLAPIIISFSVYRQNYISSKTECTSIYNKNYYRRKRDILGYKSPSWNLPIKYYVESPVNKENVRKAIKIISNYTCITFNESSSRFDNEEGLYFIRSDDCASYVGKVIHNKPQEIDLAEACYKSVPHILHEIGHALGLTHEHARSDRDKYIKIDKTNVHNSIHVNFDKYELRESINYSISYDYHSLMHYHPKDFAIDNKKDVLSSKTLWPYNRMMGQRTKMTFNDIKQINLRHCDKCKLFDNKGRRNKSYSNVNCTNSGYPDYKNCSRCICPLGYTGDNCAKIVYSEKSCGKTTFYAEPYVQDLYFYDNKTCYIYLTASRGKKIDINVTYTNTHLIDICTEEVSNQIKYTEDKGNTGLLFCGWYRIHVNFTSESNTVLIIFRGSYRASGIFFTFKEHSKENRPRKPRSINKK